MSIHSIPPEAMKQPLLHVLQLIRSVHFLERVVIQVEEIPNVEEGFGVPLILDLIRQLRDEQREYLEGIGLKSDPTPYEKLIPVSHGKFGGDL